MNPVELVIGLILVAVVVSTVAQRLQIPYPALLVLGGWGLGFVPGLPHVAIPPDVAFLVFIPPLVYLVASQFAVRDLRSNMWPILRLSVGLVLLNLFCVAAAAHWGIEGFSWSVAFVLAAIVSPTDTVAVAAVTSRIAVPTRVVLILEGESLFNDVMALVAYQQAVKTTVSGSFSLGSLSQELVWDALGGIAVGILVGAVATWTRRRVCDTAAHTAASLLTPFAAYLGAEAVQASGVLATVATGLYVGHYLLSNLRPDERVQSYSFWAGLRFILEGLAFVLLGLQLRSVMADVGRTPIGELLGDCALICGTTIVVRIAWMVVWSYRRSYVTRGASNASSAPWQHGVLIAWAGMRGVDSLAAALALPLFLADGATPFPQRNLVLFLSFSVILTTLVVQGLTFPLLIRRLRVPVDLSMHRQEAEVRIATAEAALRRLEELGHSNVIAPAVDAQLRAHYETQIHRNRARIEAVTHAADLSPIERTAENVFDEARVLRALIAAQRQTITALKADGLVGGEVLRRVERSLDYDELKLTSDG